MQMRIQDMTWLSIFYTPLILYGRQKNRFNPEIILTTKGINESEKEPQNCKESGSR